MFSKGFRLGFYLCGFLGWIIITCYLLKINFLANLLAVLFTPFIPVLFISALIVGPFLKPYCSSSDWFCTPVLIGSFLFSIPIVCSLFGVIGHFILRKTGSAFTKTPRFLKVFKTNYIYILPFLAITPVVFLARSDLVKGIKCILLTDQGCGYFDYHSVFWTISIIAYIFLTFIFIWTFLRILQNIELNKKIPDNILDNVTKFLTIVLVVLLLSMTVIGMPKSDAIMERAEKERLAPKPPPPPRNLSDCSTISRDDIRENFRNYNYSLIASQNISFNTSPTGLFQTNSPGSVYIGHGGLYPISYDSYGINIDQDSSYEYLVIGFSFKIDQARNYSAYSRIMGGPSNIYDDRYFGYTTYAEKGNQTFYFVINTCYDLLGGKNKDYSINLHINEPLEPGKYASLEYLSIYEAPIINTSNAEFSKYS